MRVRYRAARGSERVDFAFRGVQVFTRLLPQTVLTAACKDVTRSQRILIVTDDAQFESMRGALAARGFAVTAAPDYDSAYRQLLEARFDLVVIDLVETVAGVEFINRVQIPGVLKPLPPTRPGQTSLLWMERQTHQPRHRQQPMLHLRDSR